MPKNYPTLWNRSFLCLSICCCCLSTGLRLRYFDMKNPFRSSKITFSGLSASRIEKTLIRQQGQSDCGVACLASLLAYYGGHSRLERLRELSGTDSQGTTLLGLCQAARQIGFDADGMQADSIENLKTDVSVPVVLHVLIDNVLQHYIGTLLVSNS